MDGCKLTKDTFGVRLSEETVKDINESASLAGLKPSVFLRKLIVKSLKLHRAEMLPLD